MGLWSRGIGLVVAVIAVLIGLTTPRAAVALPADTTPPVTTFSVSPTPGASGWIKDPGLVVARLSATDNVGGSGFKEFRVSVNMGAETTSTANPASVAFQNDGIYSIAHWAIDLAGNVETTKYGTVKIDRTAPTVATQIQNAVLTVSASDATSGIASVQVSLDGGPYTTYTTPIPLATTVRVIRAKAVDVAGNIGETVRLTGRFLRTLTFNPSPATIGSDVTVRVDLTSAAPPGGITVGLTTSNASLLPLPATLTIPEGASFATTTVRSGLAVSDTRVQVGVVAGSTSLNGALLLTLPVPRTLTASPSLVQGGSPVTFTVTLTGKAPQGGMPLTVLSLDNTVLTVPSQVTVPEGQTTATFTGATSTQTSSRSVLVAVQGDSESAVCAVAVRPNSVASLVFTPASVIGGTASQLTITLARPNGALGVVIPLTSVGSGATVPSSITVPGGQTTATVPIPTTPLSREDIVVVRSNWGHTATRATLSILPPRLTRLAFSPTSVTGGSTTTGTLTLTGPAPPGGLEVSLTNSNPGIAAMPSTVIFLEGRTSTTFTVTTSPVAASTTVTVTAAANLDAKTVNFTVKP